MAGDVGVAAARVRIAVCCGAVLRAPKVPETNDVCNGRTRPISRRRRNHRACHRPVAGAGAEKDVQHGSPAALPPHRLPAATWASTAAASVVPIFILSLVKQRLSAPVTHATRFCATRPRATASYSALAIGLLRCGPLPATVQACPLPYPLLCRRSTPRYNYHTSTHSCLSCLCLYPPRYRIPADPRPTRDWRASFTALAPPACI
jgi:hypothetical protein